MWCSCRGEWGSYTKLMFVSAGMVSDIRQWGGVCLKSCARFSCRTRLLLASSTATSGEGDFQTVCLRPWTWRSLERGVWVCSGVVGVRSTSRMVTCGDSEMLHGLLRDLRDQGGYRRGWRLWQNMRAECVRHMLEPSIVIRRGLHSSWSWVSGEMSAVVSQWFLHVCGNMWDLSKLGAHMLCQLGALFS